MSAIILPKPFHKILVVGNLQNHIEKLSRIEELSKNYDWTIINSGISLEHINQLKQILSDSKIIYLAGRLEYSQLITSHEPWIQALANVVIADFPHHTLIVTDGGIPSNVRVRMDLFNNLEVSFISQHQDKPWQASYNGRLGYVISNNPLTLENPQYYSYSMQIGNLGNGGVYAQEIDEVGLKETIRI